MQNDPGAVDFDEPDLDAGEVKGTRRFLAMGSTEGDMTEQPQAEEPQVLHA